MSTIFRKRQLKLRKTKNNFKIEMSFHKEIKGNELYLYLNGKLIYKRWLDTGQSKVFDLMAYDKYTLRTISGIRFDIDDNISTVIYKFAVDNKGLGRLTFSGNYRHGSAGNADGNFMTEIVNKVLSHENAKSLLVDIQDLEYSFGNTIINMTTKLSNAKIPVAVMFSDKCKDIPTIDSRYFFKTENEALKLLDQTN
jgi:hypothetical protein